MAAQPQKNDQNPEELDPQQAFERKNESYMALAAQPDPLSQDPNTKKISIGVEEQSSEAESQAAVQEEQQETAIQLDDEQIDELSSTIERASDQTNPETAQALQAINQAKQDDTARKAKAVGLLKVLQGLEKYAHDAEQNAQIEEIKQQLNEIDQLRAEHEGAQSATAAFNTALNEAEKTRKKGNEDFQNDRNQAINRLGNASVSAPLGEDAKNSLAKAAGETLKEEANPLKNPTKDPTSKILNAGLPGLGILYKILGKLS